MEKKFDNNGIGKMADAHSCVVTEKRNGSFELEMVYPADGIHADQLEEGNIILAKPSDTGRSQPFRIYKIATPIDGKLTVKARHISYQLNFITVSPFATTSCTGALAGLGNHAASECPFEVWTDISSSASFRLSVPSSFRNCLGGIDGSVLDTFGGEYEWDRYTVKLHHHRGADHGVHIVYGKNLIDFKMERNIESVITGVHPYWQNSETGEVTELPEKVVLVEQRSVPYQKITVLDCTSGFQDKPTDEMMRSFAQDYLKNTSLTEPQVDIDIDFIQLWNTPDYEDVVEAEQVSLCDTVHVFISKLGIEVSSKVTETQYDCLLERYEGITLSNSTVSSRNSSLTTALSSIRNTANEAYNTALRVETSMGEQIGGISVSMVYDGTLLAGLFGLHYQNVTEVNGETVRYAFNAGSLAKSTFAWKNSPAGFFISTDGGKTWGYGWEKDDSPVKTALLLENTLQELDPNAIHWGKLREGRWCALSKSCRGLAKTLFDIMDWDQDLKYRFRGDFIENDDQKVMLFQLDEPEMVKTENIVLPPKEAETDDRAEIAGRTVKQNINILPPEWEDTFGRPITSIGEINLLEQRHYAADWDVLRPAKELAEYSTLTSEDLEELLHEAEKIIEGWPIPDEHGAGESADNGDGESAGVGTECGSDVGAGTEENRDRADL